MKLLYLQASPRLGRSHSALVADAFAEAWHQLHPEAQITRRNLFSAHLPEFDGEAVNARYLVPRGLPASPEQDAAWAKVVEMVEEFKGYDRYLLATPMWNYNVPYKLKQYLDLIFQPGLTFNPEDKAYKASLANKAFCMVLARGGEYTAGTTASAVDFQKPYLEHILRLMGFTKVCSLVVEPTQAKGPEVAKAGDAAQIAAAVRLARDF